jgi:hypothetical protein
MLYNDERTGLMGKSEGTGRRYILGGSGTKQVGRRGSKGGRGVRRRL